MPTRSYLSQSELPVTIGLGGDEWIELEIAWPGGEKQTVEPPPSVDRLIVIEQRE